MQLHGLTTVNYDDSAQYDDGSCEDEVLGCTDEEAACNYDADANPDDSHAELVATAYAAFCVD